MGKVFGALQVVFGVLMVYLALVGILGSVVPAFSALAAGATAYQVGYLVGTVLATALFLLLGLAAIRAGRRRFAAPGGGAVPR